MKKKLFLTLIMIVLAVFALSITAAAADVQVGKLWYSLDASKQNASLTISNASQDFSNSDGTPGDIVVPSTITVDNITYTVTTVNTNAFSGSTWGSN